MKSDNPTGLPRLIHGDAWVVAFNEYAFDKDNNFEQIKDQLSAKRFTVKDSGATHRLINHWSDVGIIDDSGRENELGWRKLSAVDLIWIHVLMESRRFGMPLAALKVAFQSTFYSPAKPTTAWPLFEFSVLRCLQRDPLLIVIFNDGWCEYLHRNLYDLNLQTGVLSEQAYLVVNLNRCVSKVFTKLGMADVDISVPLSADELAVIEKLRIGDVSELHIKLRDGKVHSLKNIYAGNADLQGLIDKIEFGEYTVKIQNGKTVFTEAREFQRVSS